jgi:hypothetical protein
MATTGVLWPSLYQGDGTRIRKWLYGSVLIRDWDPAGSTNMANIQVFAANGNLNPLLLVPVAAGGYGFYDVGSITENGVEFTPQFTVDETYIWQSRKSQRTDITKDDEEIMFSAAESTPLIDYLWYNLEIGFTGVPLFPSIGSPNYEIVKPFFSDVIYRQLLIIGVDGSMGANGQPEYKVELRPRVSLAKKAKRQWAAKQIDVTDLTFTTHVDPYSGYDAATLRGGTVWTDEGGSPAFAAPNYVGLAPPAANTAAVVPSTLTQVPSGTGGTFTAGTYYWKMTAVTAAGESTPGNEITTTFSGSTSSNALSWTQVTGATGYKIYRGTSTGGENVLVTTIGSGSTVTYTDTGTAGTSATPPVVNTAAIAVPSGLGVSGSGTGGTLPAGTDYWVITALTAQGETTRSNEVNANLTGTTSSAALTWTADSGATGYRIYRGTSAGGEAYLAGFVNLGATTSFTDIGSSVNASALPTHQVQLQWQQPSNLLQTFSYTITQTTGGSTTASTVVTAPSANATGLVTAVVGSLTTSNVYTFTVTVALANGNTATYPVSNAVTST